MIDITYRAEGDYLIPELILDGERYEDCMEKEIGRYGKMRERFLREYQHGTYTAMLLMGSLTTHLQEIDKQVEEEVECLLRKMMERQGVDEALKASDQMVWVRKVNALRAMLEEVVLREIVYQWRDFLQEGYVSTKNKEAIKGLKFGYGASRPFV